MVIINTKIVKMALNLNRIDEDIAFSVAQIQEIRDWINWNLRFRQYALLTQSVNDTLREEINDSDIATSQSPNV
jgi:hypothetical protein